MCYSDKIHYLGCSHVIRKHRLTLCAGQKPPNQINCQLKERTTIIGGNCFRCFLREMQDGMHGASPPREKAKGALLKKPQIKSLGEHNGNANVRNKTHESSEDVFVIDMAEKPQPPIPLDENECNEKVTNQTPGSFGNVMIGLLKKSTYNICDAM
ncbi:hypothetical protein K490DRAFT_55895 [Saccharata proteae CBS 121410]|uniref:Uncharacterized protein n=1 Tax=Saccharata proteae CBS 121410 TaxID=1314787 RepID=A0A9P4LWG4_9PEZI|nr:hypothetical protein K490DRAFT_55895 [Saccharata proteae CBS 121410]